MHLTILIINGRPLSGKDTFYMIVEELLEHSYLVHNISSVDVIKQAARALGWNGIKDEKSRQFLSDLKILSTNYNDGPLKYMDNMIKNRTVDCNHVFCLHIREPQEIKRFCKLYPQTKTLHINRDSQEINDIIVDNETEKYNYDFYLENNGTITDYIRTVESFLYDINLLGV